MTSRDKRAVLTGAALVLLSWLGLRGIPWLTSEAESMVAAADQRHELLTHARDQIARLPDLSDSLSVLNGIADSLPGMLLRGLEADNANVDLMARIRSAVEDAPATLRGFEPGSAQQASGELALTSLTVVLESDFPGLLQAVRALEQDVALAVDLAELTALSPDASEDSIEVIAARIEVSAWYRMGDSGGPAVLKPEAQP